MTSKRKGEKKPAISGGDCKYIDVQVGGYLCPDVGLVLR